MDVSGMMHDATWAMDKKARALGTPGIGKSKKGDPTKFKNEKQKFEIKMQKSREWECDR